MMICSHLHCLGSELKIHKKKMEGETTITLSMEGKIPGIKAENFYKMLWDMQYVDKADPKPKEFKLVEKIDDNTDVVYVEVALPFPMSNRDFVHKRFHACNKDDKEILQKLGFYDWSHNYYVLMIQGCEHSEYPVKKSPIRAEIKMNHWLIEEVPGEEGTLRFKTKVCQVLNGSLPLYFVNDLGPKMGHKNMEKMIETYFKIFGKQ